MQKYLIIDDEGSNLDRAVTLLRQHGYNVSLSESVPAEPKTRRSEAQQSLAKIPGKHESISSDLHSTLDAVLMARASDGKVLDLNHNFSELTGYGRDEMLGQSVLGLTFFLDPESWTNALEALERNGTADLETRILRRDGLVIFVLVSINCIQIDETPYHFMTIRSRSSGFPKTAEASRHCLPDLQINSSISSDEDINREDIGRLIDFEALQDLMNSFYKVTRIGIGINDVKGNVHVATGWQDICTRFHRVHPETLKNCLESDIYLSQCSEKQKVALYKCKNNLWDIATPIIVGGRHIANIFLGQFFFEDEVPNYECFRKQAETHGFDVKEYLAALEAVPRWSKETVENVMEFYSKLAGLISRLSISNIQLSRMLLNQKRVEEELRQSEKKARDIFDNAPIGIFRSTIEGKFVSVNPATARILKYDSPEDLIETVNKKDIAEILYLEPDRRRNVVADLLQCNDWRAYEVQYRCKDGSIITCNYHIRRVPGGDDVASELEGFVEDITDRRKAAEALRESEEKFRVLAETSPTAIVLFQGEKIVFANFAAVRMTGYSEDELLGMIFSELAHEDFRKMLRERSLMLQRGEPVQRRFEIRIVTKGGEERWVVVSGSTMEYEGKPAGIATLLDFTHAKRAEEKINAALAEKVVLLKEVHHRVKNNLQIITSLLDLQSDYLVDEGSRRFIAESQNRIRSMALVHEQLYKSGDLSHINFAGYVDELVNALFFAAAVDQHKIMLFLDVRDIKLDMDRAIPCGLIISELASNAIKYAFPGERTGKITIICFDAGEGRLMLEVSDDGVGLPPGLDFRRTDTMGLQIVCLLTRQLQGSIDLRNESGASFTIKFPGTSQASRIRRPVGFHRQ